MLFCSYMFNSVAVTENNTMELSRPSDSPAIPIIDFSAEKKTNACLKLIFKNGVMKNTECKSTNFDFTTGKDDAKNVIIVSEKVRIQFNEK